MKLAIVSSYDEPCGTATCAKAIKQDFGPDFDITIFNVKTAALIAHELTHNSAAAEAHIDHICEQLAGFECVNIHLEWGIFGRDFDIIRRRVLKLIKASKRLIITLYSLHIADHTHAMHQEVFEVLKARKADEPYWFITHLPREAETLRSTFGFENVTDFPIVYLSEKEVREFYARADAAAWKEKHGFKKDDIVILRAGFLAAHKDHMVSLKLMQLLPPNYKLAFIGGEHPPCIQKFTVSPVVKEINAYIDQYDEAAIRKRIETGDQRIGTLGDRIRFFGSQFDDDLYLAMCCSDFVTLTHLESGQSSSGIASIALQLERPVILSYNTFFMEYEKYYKGGFSFFTMGNHHELRDKIMTFDMAQVDRLKEYGKIYSMDNLAKLYHKIYADMTNGRINNSGRKINLSVVVPKMQAAVQPPAPLDAVARQQEVNRIIYGGLWRLIQIAKRVRSKLRRQRDGLVRLKRTVLRA
ncbi:MAG: hypothetical protein WAO98_06140 [Alphaproteobacteria bacterium]